MSPKSSRTLTPAATCGFLSLEPHLAAAGQFSGFSGPNLFGVAVEALRKVAHENNIPLSGGGRNTTTVRMERQGPTVNVSNLIE
jgi:hypothetical protein